MEHHPTFNFVDFNICGLHEINPSELLDFYSRNKNYLADSMPIRPPEFYEINYWQETIKNYANEYLAGKAIKFAIEHHDKMIGSIVCDQIIRGAFQACFLGYALDEKYQGKGIMSRSLQLVIEYLFENLKLHRVMANYMPNNRKSEKILLSLNFEKEGFAKKYLKINGVWQDHVLSSCINHDLI